MSTYQTQVVKDFTEKSILVSRKFEATLAQVWRAYTEPQLLDLWWGPQPWRAETKTMNFTEGGHWLYAMVSPEDEKHWGRMNYIHIDHHKSFEIEDAFCDAEGNINPDLPISRGSMNFISLEHITLVEFKMVYSTDAQLQQLVEMGFEEGIKMCLNQLEQLFIQNKI